MSSLTNLFDISIADAAELEQTWFFIINAIDNLEQMARARELTNIIWDINVNSRQTEQDWQKTAILLESYERTRDESLESALSNLRELVKIMNSSNLRNRSLRDVKIPQSFDSRCADCEQSLKQKKLS
ncbi:hypothetical protein [Pleurocapsa sp. PCC 7319]|uniref:hypothetical protein n=1 Tax=Pleurocapsa sp. PCC 7319 TaxID=118161 RepID=UPI000348437B|nr:hypothetical protein [Pleurocapsa sp. PCC 7319]